MDQNNLFSSDGLVFSKENYSDVMNNVVVPDLAKQSKNEIIHTPDKINLYCVEFPRERARGTVLFLHGFTENAFKYAEMIHSVLSKGYAALAYDQRGHGRSWRDPGVKLVSVTHVEKFDQYVSDLRFVCDAILPRFPRPWIIFAHSMGGAVASLYLEQYPDTFNRAVLCAPMIAPNLLGVPAAAASMICKTAKLVRRQRKHPFFMKPYSGPEDFDTSAASDRRRFDWYDQIKAARKDFQNSTPSYQWTDESIHVTEKILAPGAPEKIACPVLLSTAELDGSVLPEPQKAFIDRVPQGKHLFVKQARHEIFRSTDEVFFPWWHKVLSFMDEAPTTD